MTGWIGGVGGRSYSLALGDGKTHFVMGTNHSKEKHRHPRLYKKKEQKPFPRVSFCSKKNLELCEQHPMTDRYQKTLGGGWLEGIQSYQLVSMVLSCLGYNGYRGFWSDPGEGALETAPSSKEGSRRETFPMTNG